MYNEALEHINKDYLEWLSMIVDPDEMHSGLLSYLFDQEYDYETARLIPNDDNRIGDALNLREEFIKEQLAREPSYLIETFRGQYASVLEVFISLAQRMEDVMCLDRFPDWFWEMMDNLEIIGIFGERLSDKDIVKLDRIIGTWLNREYCKDGKGGLFPLKEPHENQQKVEIWYQMNAYLLENYM